jgi:hypothetical protein
MHATTDTTRPGGDVDRVARVASFEDDLVAPEEHGPGVGVDRPAVLQVEDGVDGKGAGHPGHGVDVPVPEAGRGGQLGARPVLPAHEALGLRDLHRIGVGDAFSQAGLARSVELDGEVLEAHASTFAGSCR